MKCSDRKITNVRLLLGLWILNSLHTGFCFPAGSVCDSHTSSFVHFLGIGAPPIAHHVRIKSRTSTARSWRENLVSRTAEIEVLGLGIAGFEFPGGPYVIPLTNDDKGLIFHSARNGSDRVERACRDPPEKERERNSPFETATTDIRVEKRAPLLYNKRVVGTWLCVLEEWHGCLYHGNLRNFK